jgi:ribosomal protein L37AE/L43A
MSDEPKLFPDGIIPKAVSAGTKPSPGVAIIEITTGADGTIKAKTKRHPNDIPVKTSTHCPYCGWKRHENRATGMLQCDACGSSYDIQVEESRERRLARAVLLLIEDIGDVAAMPLGEEHEQRCAEWEELARKVLDE